MTTSLAEPDRLSATDIEQLAAMHCQILPDSLVSRVGEAYARSFYRYVASSPLELVFLQRQGATVVSACVVSLEPRSLQKRLLRHTTLAPRALLALRRLPLKGIARGLTTSTGPAIQPPGPEVLLIFTRSGARSTGLGARAIERTEEHLRTRGVTRYMVKTADSPENRAIGFYLRCGFERLGVIEKNGKSLVVFAKPLR